MTATRSLKKIKTDKNKISSHKMKWRETPLKVLKLVVLLLALAVTLPKVGEMRDISVVSIRIRYPNKEKKAKAYTL